MRYWYYHESGEQKGPIAQTDLAKLFETGTLSASTLVWTESMKDWQEAGTIENLVPPSFAPPPPPMINTVASLPIHGFVACGPQVRPWIRYWARTFDFLLFSFFAGIILAIVYPAALGMNSGLLGIIVVFVYVFVEPCMLSTWGTTPGKALLNIRLRRQDGTKLNYAEALSRALSVWIRGLGLGIPIVALFTQVNAYGKLTKDGITSWDQNGGFCIAHKFIGAGRIAVIIAIFIGFAFFMVLGEMD